MAVIAPEKAPERSKHWIERHRVLLGLLAFLGALFLLGFVLHEAGVITPVNGLYEWLHTHTPFVPKEMPEHMAGWHWGILAGWHWG